MDSSLPIVRKQEQKPELYTSLFASNCMRGQYSGPLSYATIDKLLGAFARQYGNTSPGYIFVSQQGWTELCRDYCDRLDQQVGGDSFKAGFLTGRDRGGRLWKGVHIEELPTIPEGSLILCDL